MFNVNQPAPFIVTETATGLSVGGVDLTASQAVSVVAAFRKDGQLYYAVNPVAQLFAKAQDAQQRGDRIAAARYIVAMVSAFLPECGVKKLPAEDLSKLKFRDGAAAAARSAAGVLGTAPASPERDAAVTELTSLGNDAEVCDIFRDGLQQLDRQAGANEMRFLPTLRTHVETVVTTYQPQIATDPLVRRDLEPATEYLTGAAQRAADSRRRNKNQQEELTAQIKDEVTASARAEGRSEARNELLDKMVGAMK